LRQLQAIVYGAPGKTAAVKAPAKRSITTFIGGATAKGAPTTAPAAPAPEEAAEMERIEPPVKKAKGAVVSGAVVDAADEACGKTGVGLGQQASTSAVSAEATAAERGRGTQVAQPTVKERQRERKRAARGTRRANGGEIKTDHKHMCAAHLCLPFPVPAPYPALRPHVRAPDPLVRMAGTTSTGSFATTTKLLSVFTPTSSATC
jgi:hypothetical protein